MDKLIPVLFLAGLIAWCVAFLGLLLELEAAMIYGMEWSIGFLAAAMITLLIDVVRNA